MGEWCRFLQDFPPGLKDFFLNFKGCKWIKFTWGMCWSSWWWFHGQIQAGCAEELHNTWNVQHPMVLPGSTKWGGTWEMLNLLENERNPSFSMDSSCSFSPSWNLLCQQSLAFVVKHKKMAFFSFNELSSKHNFASCEHKQLFMTTGRALLECLY